MALFDEPTRNMSHLNHEIFFQFLQVKDCHCFALQPLTDVDQLCQSLHHCKYGTALFSSLKLNQPAFKTAW